MRLSLLLLWDLYLRFYAVLNDTGLCATHSPFSEVFMWKDWLREETFGEFYRFFCEEAVRLWRENGEKVGGGSWIGEEKVARCCLERVREIPVRTLIYEMQSLKGENRLMGADSGEQYADYCCRWLGEPAYLEGLRRRYPEMERLLELRVRQTVSFLREIARSLWREQREIRERLCANREWKSVETLQTGMSDSHREGRTAVRVTLDNGCRLYYKPHGIGKEIRYQRLYQAFCAGCGLKVRETALLDGGDHGWEEAVETKPCRNEEEIRRYYQRIGIHLFLAYLLGGTDLHAENLIAHGEFPVLVDVETYPGQMEEPSEKTAGELAEGLIRRSVLRTGLLPGAVRGIQEGMSLGAIHRPGRQNTGLRLPVLLHEKTADMEIAYREAVFDGRSSLAFLEGRVLNPGDYTEEVCRGFEGAFSLWLEKRTAWEEALSPFFEERARVVRRPTQAYSMLLSLSLHPDFQESGERRRTLLKTAGRGKRQMEETEAWIQRYETESLLDLDIPFFEREGISGDLLTGDGRRFPGFFAKEDGKRRAAEAEKLGKRDCGFQQMFIRLSMEGLKERDREEKRDEARPFCRADAEMLLRNLGAFLARTAVTDAKGGISWISAGEAPGGALRYQPVGWDFYDGLPGIAVFLAEGAKKQKDRNFERLYRTVRETLFAYTESRRIEKHPEGQKEGLMFGAASVTYSYLLQHRITGEPQLLEYARRQAAVLSDVWEEDTRYDLLSGNAGVLCVLTMLYQTDPREEYLFLAERIGNWLWEQAVRTPWGRGWPVDGKGLPLTGMSHGCSGFLAAYARLFQITGREKYREIMKALQKYENQFFSSETGNWIDLRGVEKPEESGVHSQNTWCHGAPGILLARMRMTELAPFRDDRETWEDIRRGAAALKNGEPPRKLCLCHGKCGNWLILREYCRRFPKDREAKAVLERQAGEIVWDLKEKKSLWLAELVSPGLMTGCAGIGMGLLKMLEDKI